MSMLIFPLILAIVYSVVMRYFFAASPDWSYEVPIFIYGTMVMMGGAYVLLEDAHVAVDLLPRIVSPVVRKILEVIICLVIIMSCVFIIVNGSQFAYQSTLLLERSMYQTAFDPPIWWFKWVIPFSAFLVVLQGIARLLKIYIKSDKEDKKEVQL